MKEKYNFTSLVIFPLLFALTCGCGSAVSTLSDAKVEFAHDDEILPPLIEAGYKKHALINPHNAIGRFAAEGYILYVKSKGIESETFNTPEEAKKWLKI